MSTPLSFMQAGIRQAVEQGIDEGDENKIPNREKKAVKKLFDEYTTARAFDKYARMRYTRDRRYASGTADKRWASDANIIGAYIDILCSFLYARDPDVSARPAARVSPPPAPAPAMPLLPPPPGPLAPDAAAGGAAPIPPGLPGPTGAPPAPDAAAPPLTAFGTAQTPPDPALAAALPGVSPALPVTPPAAAPGQAKIEDTDAKQFAETAQIVVSKLWKRADLKRCMKRTLRSVLSVGPGWFKAYMYSEEGQNPILEKELSDMRDNLERIQKLENDLTGLEPEVDEELTADELQMQIEALEKRIELMAKRGLCCDFIRAEDMQVSLDVPSLEDYRDADWISHDLYIEKDTARARFPRLTDADIRRATEYVQRETGKDDTQPVDGFLTTELNVPEGTFVRATDNVGQGAGTVLGGKDKPVKFIKVVELWDHRDMHVKTMVDGVERWAKLPYVPPHASRRFFPFFKLAFYEVDGSRHPQSLPERSWKLQDEYSSRRSSGRKTRERSIPGTVFNSGEMDPDQVKKLEQSTEMEMVGVRTTTVGADINKVMAAKPIPRVDPMIFDTKDILYDLDVVVGMTQALSSGQSSADTATEADLQQSGTEARSGAARNAEEDILNELAQYTLEIAVQAIDLQEAKRLAGPYAFWPYGMDVEDILTMVEIEIEAGTTGKPRKNADKETWATLLPLILDIVPQIRLAEASGDLGMAETLKNILRETLRRLDDRLGLESILSATPAPPMMPGMPPGGPATSAKSGDAGGPPTGNGTVNNPVAQGAPPAATA